MVVVPKLVDNAPDGPFTDRADALSGQDDDNRQTTGAKGFPRVLRGILSRLVLSLQTVSFR